MSLIDRSFDPMPRRTPRTGRATHSAFGWFANPTVRRARYFQDVAWWRLLLLPVFGLSLLGLIELTQWSGNLAALARIVATLLVFAGSYGALARLAGFLRHGD